MMALHVAAAAGNTKSSLICIKSILGQII